MKILKKEVKKEELKVFNIGVEENNNYFVEKILVHNCYVSANKDGINYPDICDTWKNWMNEFDTKIKNGVTITNAPFQIAIGEIFISCP